MRRLLSILIGLSFLNVWMANIALSALAVIQQRFELDSFALGIVIAMPSFASIATFYLIGHLSDRLGRRRIILAGLTVAASGAMLIYYAILTQNLALLLAGRALSGLSDIATFPQYLAIASEKVEAQLLPSVMGWIEGATSIGGVLGPPIGGFLLVLGTGAPFGFNAIVASLGLLMAFQALPRQTARRQGQIQGANPVLPAAPLSWTTFVGGFVCLALLVAVQGFLGPLLVQRFSLNDQARGLVLALVPAAMVAGSLVISVRPNFLSGRGWYNGIALLGFLGVALIGFSGSLIGTLTGLLAVGFGIGVWLPIIDHDVTTGSSEDGRGRNLATLQASKTSGTLVVPILMGLVLRMSGFEWAYLSLALFGFAGGLVMVAGRWPKRTPVKAPGSQP